VMQCTQLFEPPFATLRWRQLPSPYLQRLWILLTFTAVGLPRFSLVIPLFSLRC